MSVRPLPRLASCCGLFLLFALDSYSGAASRAKQLSDFDPQVKKLLETMTLDEKIGQMTQPDQLFLKRLDDIGKYHLGSLLNGGDSDPKTGTV